VKLREKKVKDKKNGFLYTLNVKIIMMVSKDLLRVNPSILSV
jgi:hypothetical protein